MGTGEIWLVKKKWSNQLKILKSVDEVYSEYKDVMIFHGVSPWDGALSIIPEGTSFAKRVDASIDKSKKEGIFAFSIRFGHGPIDNRVYTKTGIGIKCGGIFRHYSDDSGRRYERLDDPNLRESDAIDQVIDRDENGHNEFILRNIVPCCVYYSHCTLFKKDELVEACSKFDLPLCELTEDGLRVVVPQQRTNQSYLDYCR